MGVFPSMAIDYAINDDISFSSITGFCDVFDLQSYPPVFGLIPTFIVGAPGIDLEQLTQEFRLASSFDGAVNFVTGVIYEQKEVDTYLPIIADISAALGLPVPLWVDIANTEYRQDSEAASAFVDLTWNNSDNLELSGGVRYSWEEKDFIGVDGFVGDRKEHWDDVSPQLTLSRQTNEQWMLYASYREGFVAHPEFAPGTTQDSYSKVNAAIRLSDPTDTWYVALIGRNLTDEYVVTSAGTTPTAVRTGTSTEVGSLGDAIGFVGVGRTLSLELGYTFR